MCKAPSWSLNPSLYPPHPTNTYICRVAITPLLECTLTILSIYEGHSIKPIFKIRLLLKPNYKDGPAFLS